MLKIILIHNFLKVLVLRKKKWIIGLLTRDPISYLTPSCVDINHEDLALNAFVTKWMIQFQIYQKNVHIVEQKVIIVRTDKLNNKIQFKFDY